MRHKPQCIKSCLLAILAVTTSLFILPSRLMPLIQQISNSERMDSENLYGAGCSDPIAIRITTHKIAHTIL